jgi:O-methyltransferase involved in polyketide biosynthesis
MNAARVDSVASTITDETVGSRLEPLTGVPETLLVPLCVRCLETRSKNGLVRDERAVEIVEGLGCDCSTYVHARSLQTGIAVRTEILDRVASSFLARHDDAVVVNLGSGLCSRFARIDNARVHWFELDLPVVRPLWNRFFTETDRHRYWEYSVTDFSWMTELEPHVAGAGAGKSVLFIAEGLFMYFTERDVKRVILEMRRRFPGSELLIEAISPILTWSGSWQPTARFGASFTWGIRTLEDLKAWDKNIHLIEEWYLLDYHGDRWGWWMKHMKRVRGLRTLLKVGHVLFV